MPRLTPGVGKKDRDEPRAGSVQIEGEDVSDDKRAHPGLPGEAPSKPTGLADRLGQKSLALPFRD